MPAQLSVKWLHEGAYRRFSVCDDATAGTVWNDIVNKTKQLVPGFQGKLVWTDADGDSIIVSSGIDLTEARKVLKLGAEDVLRLHTVADANKPAETKANEAPNQPNERAHQGVHCDGCEQFPIVGCRYKCLQCADYDLCAGCENKGVHRQHTMIRIADPDDQSWKWMHWREYARPFLGAQGGRGNWRRAGFGNGRCGGAHRRQQHQQQHADGNQQQQHNNEPNPLHFLREVGEQVAAALTNLGIDVDIDVEHGNSREKVQTKDKPKESTKPAEKPTEPAGKPEEAVKTDEPKKEEPQKESAEATAKTDNSDGSNSPTGESDWTLLHRAEAEMQKVLKNVTEGLQSGGLYPTAPLAEAAAQAQQEDVASARPTTSATFDQNAETLKHLLGMGFDNDDGWLQQLVEAKKGDINAVLNALHPRQ